jgi:hypothetical protein
MPKTRASGMALIDWVSKWLHSMARGVDEIFVSQL